MMGKQNIGDFYIVPETCQIAGISEMITDFIGNKTDGVFVEIGGNDGETFGCTAGLADMGWTGYYIEPLESAALACVERHKDNNVLTIQCAIGTEEGEAKLHVSTDKYNAYSTLTDDIPEHNPGLFDSTITTNVYTLDNILDAYVHENIDIMVIDTEGTEMDVLMSFKRLKERLPRMIIIESNSNPDIISGAMALTVPEYTLVYSDGINMILCLTVDVERYQEV